MGATKKFLIAISEDDASLRAVRYLGEMVGGHGDVRVSLLHVLGPLPPELLETGGAADEASEREIEAEQEEQQRRWIERARAKKAPLFAEARRLLHEAGLSPDQVHDHAFETIPEDHVAARILEAAEHCGCNTVVLGRSERGWLAEVVRPHTSHAVLRRARGFAVWVVG